MTTRLRVDDLDLELRISSRRRTMEITVDRTGRLILTAPPDAPEDALRTFVADKRFWIYTKLAEKEALHRPVPRKEFVDGEGFLYLGRSYRLKLVDDDQDDPLKLVAGRFRLRRDAMTDGATHFIRWYAARGQAWLSAKVAEHAARLEVDAAGVRVQDLGYRWGSCGKGGWLYFHWKTMLLPGPIAEYVVLHELVHLRVPHHTPEFWQTLRRSLPDFERRKEWLAENGMTVEGLQPSAAD